MPAFSSPFVAPNAKLGVAFGSGFSPVAGRPKVKDFVAGTDSFGAEAVDLLSSDADGATLPKLNAGTAALEGSAAAGTPNENAGLSEETLNLPKYKSNRC